MISFKHYLASINMVREAIHQKRFLILAADEQVLAGLPQGNWIGGTTPYFMSKNGGVESKDHIYATEIVDANHWQTQTPKLMTYDESTIHRIGCDAFLNGFTLLIFPFGSSLHQYYSKACQDFEHLFYRPIVGWVSGVHADDIGHQRVKAKVRNGSNNGFGHERAVAIHVPLYRDQQAHISINSEFDPKASSDVIRFPRIGLKANQCLINGAEWNLADYYREFRIDPKLPLIGDFAGNPVNVSIQQVHEDTRIVDFFAPVYPNVDYRLAKAVEFENLFSTLTLNSKDTWACSCILNYMYGNLKGKKGGMPGPFTFGEIAYQVVNQSLVTLTLSNNPIVESNNEASEQW